MILIISCGKQPSEYDQGIIKNKWMRCAAALNTERGAEPESSNLFGNALGNIFSGNARRPDKFKWKLIEDPKKQIQTLLESCNLSWNNKCLNYHNNKRVIKTASDIQVRKKLYKSSTGLWKNYDKYLKDFFIKLPN